MTLATKKVKELKYYLMEQKKAVEELTNEFWHPSHTSSLNQAFKKGYEAKQFYDRKKK